MLFTTTVTLVTGMWKGMRRRRVGSVVRGVLPPLPPPASSAFLVSFSSPPLGFCIPPSPGRGGRPKKMWGEGRGRGLWRGTDAVRSGTMNLPSSCSFLDNPVPPPPRGSHQNSFPCALSFSFLLLSLNPTLLLSRLRFLPTPPCPPCLHSLLLLAPPTLIIIIIPLLTAWHNNGELPWLIVVATPLSLPPP